jgi:hypothetical protein
VQSSKPTDRPSLGASNEEVAKVSVPNNTPASKLEQMMSERWGGRVQLRPGTSMVWLPNKRYEFVSGVPGQKAAMTEAMRARLESEEPPKEIDIMVTVVDDTQRYSAPK